MKELFLYDGVMHPANKHLISACVGGARNIEINQREVWVKRRRAAAEVWAGPIF